MKNVKITFNEDGILTIEVDLTKEHGLSGSGKNIIIASTGGNIPLAEPFENCKVGLNLYKAKRDGAI